MVIKLLQLGSKNIEICLFSQQMMAPLKEIHDPETYAIRLPVGGAPLLLLSVSFAGEESFFSFFILLHLRLTRLLFVILEHVMDMITALHPIFLQTTSDSIITHG